MQFIHFLRVRYSELDPQGVVFNANYLMYCDDALETWFRTTIPEGLEAHDLDLMLKKAVLEWLSPARLGDTLEIGVTILRWGNSSFDVKFKVDGIFNAVITYVCVQHLTNAPQRFPDFLREKLS